jgi:hypothetical protein
MTLRTQFDGQPYYCIKCGLGFYEMLACELPDCEREDVRVAERRRDSIKRAGEKLAHSDR